MCKAHIVKSNVLRILYVEGLRLYEIEISYNNGETRRGLKVPFTDVEGKREIKRFPSLNKVRSWLNSMEGLTFLNESFSDTTL